SQMTRRRVGMPSAGLLSRYATADTCPGPTPAGVYQPSLRSPGLVAPDGYKAILDKGLEGEALVAAEKEMFDFTSPQVGSQMIDSWELQSFLSDAVLYQYEPADTLLLPSSTAPTW
ncbi:MAG: HDOD domain-containing protein, partial [Candidatus Thiodiazotropha sp. (ex Ustalcina ferruginea)]|nr:HDOD domain-containing protein [Candidatus Thiodiazotropha sp. (ex Ustalcina ferruginea)]